MRELAPQDKLNLPRDHKPILWVPAQTWRCLLCDPLGTAAVASSTVVWLGSNVDGPSGRCSSCGQLYALARAFESVPTIEEQLGGAS